MAAFRVPTQNRFAQLDSDVESDFDKHAFPPKKVVNESPVHVVAEASQRPSRSAPESKPSKSQQGFTGSLSSSRGSSSRGFGRGLRSAAPRVLNNQQPEAAGDAQSTLDTEAVFDETGRDIRRPPRFNKSRFERGGRGGSSFRGREFERRSGTGRGKEMKKAGGGGHNWGTPEGGWEGAATARSEEEATDESPSNTETGEEKAPDSSPEADKQPKPRENRSVDFSEWQKTQEQKRQVLLQEKLVDVTNRGPVRSVNAADLEKEGYRLYERDTVEESRAGKDGRYQQCSDDEGEHGDGRRPKTYKIYDITGDYGGRRGGRGARRGRGGEYNNRRSQQPPAQTVPAAAQAAAVLDLKDMSAFPSL